MVGIPILLAWRRGLPVEPGRVAASLSFLVLGMQVVASSVLLSVLGIRRRRGG